MLIETGYGLLPRLTGHRGEAAAGPAYLDSVISSACCDLDATIADSYSGSGTTWANLIESPADGAAQTDYDLSISGFSFVGAAGSDAAYFSCNNTADYFENATAGNILNGGMRSDIPEVWFAMTWYPLTYTSTERLFGPGANNSVKGWRVEKTGADALYQGHHAAGNLHTYYNAPGVNENAPNILLFSWKNGAFSGNLRLWVNSGTAFNTLSKNYGTYTADAQYKFRIGRGDDVNRYLMPDTRVYSFAAGNEFLDDTKATAIIEHLEARHGRDYTP